MKREHRRWLIAFAAVMATAMLSIGGCGLLGQATHDQHSSNQTTANSNDDKSDTLRKMTDIGVGLHDPRELEGIDAGVDESYPGEAALSDEHGDLKPSQQGKTQTDDSRSDEAKPDVASDTSAATGRVMLDVPQRVQETGYWCVPAALQMVLAHHGIEASQSTLASRMNTVPVTGTEYVDLARVANAYLFGVEDANPSGAGYHVQTIAIGDTNPAIATLFAERVKTDLASGDPVFAAVDVHVLYPHFGHANHVVVIFGYDTDEQGTITQYHFLDPSYAVQDANHGGHKVVDAASIVKAIVTNEEPAYIW